MLNIDIRPIKGILFVRLSGKLNHKNIHKLNKEVIKFQKKVGIKNIVFNVGELTEIDNYGKYALIDSFNLCKFNNGQSFICLNNNKEIASKLNGDFHQSSLINEEIDAINLINS